MFLIREDDEHGGIAVTYNDVRRSEDTGIGRAMTPYYAALLAQNGGRMVEDLDKPEVRFADIKAAAAGLVRYDDNGRCVTCGEQYADPHDPNMPCSRVEWECEEPEPVVVQPTAAQQAYVNDLVRRAEIVRKQCAGRGLRRSDVGDNVLLIDVTTAGGQRCPPRR